MSDDPIRQQAAAASTGNAELLIIDVATFDHLIHAGHQVFVIVAGIMILNHVPKFLAVADAAARIRIQHRISLRCHPLKFVIENETVGDVRAAMNVQDQRVLLMRIETGRPLYPGLDAFAVETVVPNLFRIGEIQFREQPVIDVG